MPIKMIPTYITGDGKDHADLDVAVRHERHVELCHVLFATGRAPMGSIDAMASLVEITYPEIKRVMEADFKADMINDARERARAKTGVAKTEQIEKQEQPDVDIELDDPKAIYDAYGKEIELGYRVRYVTGKLSADMINAKITWPAIVTDITPDTRMVTIEGFDGWLDPKGLYVVESV